jgi:uncharacterized protein
MNGIQILLSQKVALPAGEQKAFAHLWFTEPERRLKMEIQEHPFYLDNKGVGLYCIKYLPAGSPKGGVVLCHPFGEEKLWAQRIFVSFARLLASNGYSVLRVDYMGHGDSEGDFEQSTLRTRISDIDSALEHLKSQLPPNTPLGLAGLRLGATLAAMLCEERKDVRFLVLWEPIVDGKSYLRQLLRINIATQSAVYKEVVRNSEALVENLRRGETINVDGYEIGRSFYEQLNAVDLLEGEKRYGGEVLLVSIARNPEKVNRPLLKLKQKYPGSSYAAVVEESFWNNVQAYCRRAENLFEQTLRWLEAKNDDSGQNTQPA